MNYWGYTKTGMEQIDMRNFSTRRLFNRQSPLTQPRAAKLPYIVLALGAAALLILASCGKDPRGAIGRLDTPEHHTRRGNDFLLKNDWKRAGGSFDQALSLKPEHSPALAGKSIVVAHAAGQGGSGREDNIDKSDDLFHDALSEARNDDEQRIAYVAGIRMHRLAKPDEDWLEEAEDNYEEAVDLDERQSDPAPHFYMARAYRDAFQMQKASSLYKQVLEMNRGLVREADEELAIVQKIERAAPGTLHGRAIAFDPSISRADISALFVEELKLPELYERGNQKRFDTGFKSPQGRKFEADILKKAPEMTDVGKHPLAADIEEVVRLRVSGLQPDPSHQFHPYAKILRAEFAIMIEDILVRVTGERGLKTKFIGQTSPFNDIRNDLPYFNAIMTVVTRNLMEPKNRLQAVFGPTDPLTAADALLVIRLIKSELRRYIRS